ncbi:hypothetical protein CLOM_g13388 [Closterium sp. NIES-68]|nr:hypothetical protein CLOM_g13388 [Closterium sp. NIES-68]GJP72398.1 hypothetical protein CLOP_g3135 [Closterium sp. NIES-67]GJP81335.1 hypothetical protein CLOP_g11500 [Closterium sp. NIES-67]
MARTGFSSSTVLLLLVAAAALALPAIHAQTTYPACPLTGSPPSETMVPPYRCLAAAKMSCCMPCGDYELGLRLIKGNASRATEATNTGPYLTGLWNTTGVFPSGPPKTCDLLSGYQQCELLMESIACASTCNPDSGNYVIKDKDGPTITICPKFADDLYAACKDSRFGTINNVTDAITFGSLTMSGAGAGMFGIISFRALVANVTDAKCFAGPTPAQIPKTTLCCDSFPLDPSQCPVGTVDLTKYTDLLYRNISTDQCMNDTKTPKTIFTLPPSPSVPKASGAVRPSLVGLILAAVFVMFG